MEKSDKFLVGFSITLVIAGVLGFFSDFITTNTQEKNSVATIINILGKAKVQPKGTVAWSNAYNGQKLSNGDRVITSKNSSAIIKFNKTQYVIHLSPNTLVRVDADSNNQNINLILDSGFFEIDYLNIQELEKIKINGKKIDQKNLDPKKSLRVTKKSEDESATIIPSFKTVKPKTKLKGPVENRPINSSIKKTSGNQLLSPQNEQEFSILKTKRINLTWSNPNEDSVQLEVSDSYDFDETLVSTKTIANSHRFTFPESGIYYWRLKDSNGKSISETRSFRLVEPDPPKLESPRFSEERPFNYKKNNIVNFRWSTPHFSDFIFSYRHSSQKRWNQQIVSSQKSLQISIKKPGTYIWKVSFDYENAPFSQERRLIFRGVDQIELLTPRHLASFDIQGKRKSIKFNWKAHKDEEYILKLKRKNDPSFDKEIQALGEETQVLFKQEGEYYWSVSSPKYKIESEVQSLKVLKSAAQDLNPSNYAQFKSKKGFRTITFDATTNLDQVNFLVYREENLIDPLLFEKDPEFPMKVRLKKGKYFWKIEKKPHDKNPYIKETDLFEFTIK